MGTSPDQPPTPPPLTLKKSELSLEQQRLCENWILERRQTYHKGRAEAEAKVIQALFVLNTGVFAAVVGRSVSRDLDQYFLISLFCSASGIFMLLVRAAWTYYRAEFGLYGTFAKDADAFNQDMMGMTELDQRDRVRCKGSHWLHGMAVISAILFLVAAYSGIRGILAAGQGPFDRSLCLKTDSRGFGFATAVHRECTREKFIASEWLP
jgi:hypothetical protein